jgi:uncharacterized membrane protein
MPPNRPKPAHGLPCDPCRLVEAIGGGGTVTPPLAQLRVAGIAERDQVALVLAVALRSGNQMMVLQVVLRSAGGAEGKLHGEILLSMDMTDFELNGCTPLGSERAARYVTSPPSWRKSSGLAIFTAVCLLGESTGLAHAQVATEWSGGKVINLPGLPGLTISQAYGINDAGQVVGFSGGIHATEWSGGKVGSAPKPSSWGARN